MLIQSLVVSSTFLPISRLVFRYVWVGWLEDDTFASEYEPPRSMLASALLVFRAYISSWLALIFTPSPIRIWDV